MCRSRISKVLPISCIFEFLTPTNSILYNYTFMFNWFLKKLHSNSQSASKTNKKYRKEKEKRKKKRGFIVQWYLSLVSLSLSLFSFVFFFFFWWIRIFVLQRMLGIRGKKKGQKPFEKGIEDAETILLSVRGSFGWRVLDFLCSWCY